MKAAVLKKVKELVVEEIQPLPAEVPAGMVRVAVKAVGICGSDVHYYQEGAIGSYILQAPMVLGHEVGGVVEAVGAGVDIPVGTVVALEPGIPCKNCRWCREGEYNLCPDVQFFATPPVHGAMTTFVDHPAAYTFTADGLTPEEACLAEPLSVGVYAVRKARLHVGTTVAITGAGPVGVLTALAAQSEGATVHLYDVQPSRVAFAAQLGFNAYTFGADQVSPNGGYDVAIDCSGNGSAISWAQQQVRRGGRLILVGMGTAEGMKIDGLDLCLRGIEVQGIFRYANTFPAAIELIRRHRSMLQSFTETTIELDELPDYLAKEGYKQSLKTIVTL